MLHPCIIRKAAGLQTHCENSNVPIRLLKVLFCSGEALRGFRPHQLFNGKRSLAGGWELQFLYVSRPFVFTCSFLISFLRSASYFSFWFAFAALWSCEEKETEGQISSGPKQHSACPLFGKEQFKIQHTVYIYIVHTDKAVCDKFLVNFSVSYRNLQEGWKNLSLCFSLQSMCECQLWYIRARGQSTHFPWVNRSQMPFSRMKKTLNFFELLQQQR